MPTKTHKLSWEDYVIYTDDREPLVKRHEWIAFLTNALYIVRTYPDTAYLYNLYHRQYCPIVRYYDAASAWTTAGRDNDEATLVHDIVLNTTFAAYHFPTLEAAQQAAEEHYANA